jgi:polysaccharide biosynthesis PFTS motif protein
MLFLVQFYCIRHPFLWLFWKDFTEHSIVKELNSKGILNGVVYTNSNMNTEPLWATDLCGRKFKTSIALYSLNMFTLRGKKSLIRDAPPPIFGLLRSDEMFIWLPECEKILRNEGLKIKTRVAPPILWLYSEPLKKTIHSHKFNISLYDVTPGKFIDSDFYYSFEIMKEFTASVINAVKRVNNDYGCEIQIFHKYKRPPIRGVHDDRYIDYIDAVSTESNIFTSVNNTNVYDLLSRTDLSIVAPYSSVAYIASDLKINSVFYDPLSLLVKDYIETPYINFIDNENDLYNFIGGLYRNKMKIYSGVANESV